MAWRLTRGGTDSRNSTLVSSTPAAMAMARALAALGAQALPCPRGWIQERRILPVRL